MHKAPTDKKKDRQRWATPSYVVNGIAHLTGRGFDVDLCAEAWSAKHEVWMGPGSDIAENAFEVSWGGFWSSPWCNPPYNNIDPWAEGLVENAETFPDFMARFLVPARTDRPWWHLLLRHGWVTFIEGRIEFDPPPGVAAPGAMGGVVLWQIGGREPLMRESISVLALQNAARAAGRSAA